MAGKSKEKQRPGVVVYFDMVPTLQKLSAEAKAAVLMAALARGQNLYYEADFNSLGDLADRVRAETLWESYCPRVDSDGEGWKDGIIQRKYAGYCSGCRSREEQPMSYEEYRGWYLGMEEMGSEPL